MILRSIMLRIRAAIVSSVSPTTSIIERLLARPFRSRMSMILRSAVSSPESALGRNAGSRSTEVGAVPYRDGPVPERSAQRPADDGGHVSLTTVMTSILLRKLGIDRDF